MLEVSNWTELAEDGDETYFDLQINYTNNQSCPKSESEAEVSSVLRVLVPMLVVAGVLGNLSILLVLRSSKLMKAKTHLLLTSMAAADLAHSVVAMVLNLYLYEAVIDTDEFSRIYHHQLKIPFLTLANWLSMSSTWFAVAVTVERLIAIRYPLKARFFMRKRFMIQAITGIALVSFLLSSYYLIWLRPVVMRGCDSRYLYRMHPKQSLFYFGFASRHLHAVLCSLIPVALLFVFNGLLVHDLHRNQIAMRSFGCERCNETVSLAETNGYQSPHCRNRCVQLHTITNRREYKVALVVMVISLTSAVCLLPSVVMVGFDTLRLVKHSYSKTPSWYFLASDISNLLILSEKVTNFFLYCLTSGSFRRRLLAVLCRPRRGPSLLRADAGRSRHASGCRSNHTSDRYLQRSTSGCKCVSSTTITSFFLSTAGRVRKSVPSTTL